MLHISIESSETNQFQPIIVGGKNERKEFEVKYIIEIKWNCLPDSQDDRIHAFFCGSDVDKSITQVCSDGLKR